LSVGARQWFDIHSFTGVFTGLLLLVICWTGTVATLSYEIDWLVTPEMRVEPYTGQVNLNAVEESVLDRFPLAQIQMIRVPRYQRSALEVVIRSDDLPRTRVFVDPGSAEVLGISSMANVQRFFRSLHRRLFLPNPLGIILVSLFAVSLAVSVVSALMFYKRWWTRFFRFRPGRRKAWMSELHKTGGLWALLFAVLIALTGIWYGLEATGAPHALFAEKHGDKPPALVPGPKLTLEELVTIASKTRPDIEVNQIFPPGSFFGDDRLRVAGQGPDLFLRDRVNSVTVSEVGQVLENENSAGLSGFKYWVNMADPLHFGNFAGLVSKIFWFAFGLLLCALCLTGINLHGKRLHRQGGLQGRAYWRGTLSAFALAVLMMLVSVPLGIDEVARYLGILDLELADIPLGTGVFSFIAGWLAVTFAMLALCLFWLWRGVRPAAASPF